MLMYGRMILLLVWVLSGVMYNNSYAQCGPEDITVTDWCENTFAKWEFDNPTPNASYTWYNYNGATYTPADLDANGHIIKPGSVQLDSLTIPEFYSPFRIREADLANPAAGIAFTYVKRVRYNAVDLPTPVPAFSNGSGTFGMNFSLSESVRLNSVKVPVILNTPGKQYKIQVMAGATGSAIYSFSTLSATQISGNHYIIEIPVDLTLAAGNHVLTININPTGGSGASVDGLLYSPQQPAAEVKGPLTIGAASANASGSNYSVIYDWDFTVTCAPVNTPAAMKQTTGCCQPPASLELLSFNSDKSAIVHNGSENAALIVGSGDPASYFAWYHNGTFVPAASGIGSMTYSTNQTGTWEVREVRNQTDLDNPSCYASRSLILHERRVFASIVSAPSNNPLCIGDQWVLSGTGSNNLTWSAGRGSLSPATGTSTTYTATEVGSTTITLTGEIITGNLILNGDFENATLDQSIPTEMPYASNPTGTDGSYTVTADALNNGAWSNSDWDLSNQRPTVKGNPGRFLLINGTENATSKPLIWGQNVSVTAGKEYVFSFDMTSVSYIVSDNMAQSYGNTPTAPWRNVVLEVYINGVLQGTASTDFAANGGLDAVGKWMNHTFTWTAGSSETQATLEIRQITPANEPRGYDYGLDNIAFGGFSVQTDEIAIGPVTDCSSITASASACIDDTLSELTATLTGGLVFDRWENEAGEVVGTDNPLRVKSTESETYTAYAFLVAGNVLDNGDFESGNVGFISGSPEYYSYVTSMPSGAHNSYVISANTNAGNGAWLNLTPPVGGSRMFSADAKGPAGQKIIAWTFEAEAGKQFLFSGWAANQHIDYQNNPNNNTPTGWIGVSITAGTPNSATDPLLTDFDLPKDNLWHQRTAIWTAPSTGTFTLYLKDMRGSNGGGNDFVLDDFSLSPITGIIKTATATTPVCNPCLGIAPTLADAGVCGGMACFTIDTTGSTAVDNTAFEWYASETGGSMLSSAGGQNPFCVDVTSLTKSGSDYQIWVEDKRIYSGMVGAKPACSYNYDNVDKYHQEIVVYRDITLTELKFMAQGYSSGNKTTRLQVYTHDPARNSSNGGPSNTIYREDNVGVTYMIADQNVPVEVTYSLPAGFTLTGSPEGTRYWIRLSGGDRAGTILNCGGLPVTDNVPDEQIIDLRRTTDYGNNPTSNNFGSTYDIKFDYKSKFSCGRFLLTVPDVEHCPCAPPVSVDINPAFDKDTLVCAGSNLTLSADYELASGPLNGYTYTWIKKTGSVIDTLQGPLALASSPLNGTLTYNLSTITGADAGQYILRIEDGTAGSSACFADDTLELVVSLPVVAGTIGSDETICSGSTASLIEGATAPTGGTGTYYYKWEQSVDGTTWTAISGATSEDYTPGALTSTTHYRRIDSSGVCPGVATNAVTITIEEPVVAGTIGSDETICAGSTASLIEGATAPTGGTGTYYYKWEQSVDGTNWAGISGATSEDYAPGTLASTMHYRRIDSSGVCSGVATNAVTITIEAPVVAGTIGSDEAICAGSTASLIEGATAPTGGTGTYYYKWEQSVDGTTWTAISGATSEDYAPGTLASTMHYRRIDSSGVCSGVATNAVTITIEAPVVAGTIGSDETICSGSTASLIEGATAPTGGTGTYYYKWEQSVDGTTWTAISGATSEDYAPGALPSTMHYRRIDSSGVCPGVATNAVTITIEEPVVAGTIGSDETICAGSTASLIEGATAPTGGTGTYYYKWEQSVDGATWAEISGATSEDYAPGTLTSTMHYRRIDSSGVCPGIATNAITVTVEEPVVAGTIGSDETICSGSAVSLIEGMTVPTSGTGTYYYKWEQSVDGTTWTEISGATSEDYAPGVLTSTMHYRRIDSSGVCPGIATNAVTITIEEPVVAGTIGSDETICSGSTASLIEGATAPTGGTGTYTYQWEQSADGMSWTAISGAISEDYAPGALTSTMHYRRLDLSGACPGIATNTITITVEEPVVAGTIGSDETICSGSTASLIEGITAPTGGTGTYTYQWEQSADGTSWTAISGATSEDYAPGALTSTTHFRRIDLSGVCPEVATNMVTITIEEPVVAGTIGSDETICSGSTASLIEGATAPTGGTGIYTYQWEQSADGTSWTAISGATSEDYAPGALTSTTHFRRIDLSGVCPEVATNMVTITIEEPVVAGTIGSDETICAGSTASLIEGITASTGGTGTYTYQWEQSVDGTNWAAISGATSVDYAPGTLSSTMHYRRIDLSGVCPGVETNAVTITIEEPVVAGTIGSDETICAGSTASLIEGITAPTGGTGTYTYQWEQSADGTNWTAISGATSEDYAPGALTSTMHYRRIDMSGMCPDVTTNQITVIVLPVVTPGTISGEATICSGNTLPAPMTELAAPAGGDGIYTYQWQYSADGLTGWTSISGATSATYNPPSSQMTTTVFYRRLDGSAGCEAQPTNILEITVNAGITAGTIGADQEICYNTVPAALNMQTAPAGITSNALITWEQSADNGLNWTTIAGQSGDNYVFTQPLTSPVLIRKRVTDPSLPLPCNVAVTPEVSILVQDELFAGTISDDQGICAGQQPATLTGSAATGGTGTYNYLWQSSVNNGASWTTATGINDGVNYTPSALNQTTWFRRLDNDGLSCGPLTSNHVEITISPNLPVSVSITDPGENCPGTPLTFIATPVNEGNNPVYRWTVNGADQGVNSAQFTSSSLVSNDLVRVELVSSEQCKTGSPAVSNTVTVRVTAAVTPSVSLPDPGTLCAGASTTFIPVANGGGNSTYEWYVNGQMVATSHYAAPSFTYSFADGDEVYVVLQSSLPCATQPTAVSNTIRMRLLNTPQPVIHANDTTICEGDQLVLTTTYNSSAGRLTWYQSGQAVAVNTDRLNILASGVFRVGIDNGACPEMYSAEVRVTIINRPVADAGPDIYVKENDPVQLQGSGSGIYLWSPATGLSDPASANPHLTAENTITYTLTVSDPGQRCFATDEVTVIVEKALVIPNVVTPNGDGLNDVWEITNIEGFPDAVIKIFNRWGTLVWESHGYRKSWDGTNYRNGQLLPDGTYFYVIELNSSVFPEPHTGYVQILK